MSRLMGSVSTFSDSANATPVWENVDLCEINKISATKTVSADTE
jgi:hypothetical protein